MTELTRRRLLSALARAADAVGFARAVEIGYEMARADLLNRIRGTVELAHLNDAPATPPQEAAQ